MEENEKNMNPESDPGETALDIGAFVSSAIPWIGGPISNVLSGISGNRRRARIREVLEGLANDLRDFRFEVSESYVNTDEFEELLENTLRRAADERNEDKRRIYRAFLTDAIKSPGKPYDEQIRILRTLEKLQPDHFRVIRALSQAPDKKPGTMGSPSQTLRRRLPEMREEPIEDLVKQLNDLRVTDLTSLKTMMTGQGAEDLRGTITSYGNRFLKYILDV